MGRRRWIRLYKIRLLQPQDITVQTRKKNSYKKHTKEVINHIKGTCLHCNFINAKEYVIKHGSKNAQAGEHSAFDFTSIPYQKL